MKNCSLTGGETTEATCKTKKLKQSKIAWGGVLIAFLSALQLAMIELDMTKFENEPIPAIITLVTSIAVVMWRRSSEYIIE